MHTIREQCNSHISHFARGWNSETILLGTFDLQWNSIRLSPMQLGGLPALPMPSWPALTIPRLIVNRGNYAGDGVGLKNPWDGDGDGDEAGDGDED